MEGIPFAYDLGLHGSRKGNNMAKLIREWENGIEKRTLIFRGEELSYHMIPTSIGANGDAKCFVGQLEDKFPDVSEDILDEIDLLDCETDEDEIFRMLEILEEAE